MDRPGHLQPDERENNQQHADEKASPLADFGIGGIEVLALERVHDLLADRGQSYVEAVFQAGERGLLGSDFREDVVQHFDFMRGEALPLRSAASSGEGCSPYE